MNLRDFFRARLLAVSLPLFFLPITVSVQAERLKDGGYHYPSDIEFGVSLLADPGKRKSLANAQGSPITLEQVMIFGRDTSEWEQGGKLQIMNDYTAGPSQLVTCHLSPKDGDEFMEKRGRVTVKMNGEIASYSSRRGLDIDPCYAVQVDPNY